MKEIKIPVLLSIKPGCTLCLHKDLPEFDNSIRLNLLTKTQALGHVCHGEGDSGYPTLFVVWVGVLFAAVAVKK